MAGDLHLLERGLRIRMHVAALTIELQIPGCDSLKGKRSRLKPLLHALQRTFNVSASEIEHHDNHNYSTIACVTVSNEARHAEQVLAKIPAWIESHRPDLFVVDSEIAFR